MGEWRSILYIITERERAAESGRQGIILVWSFTSIYFFPFISPLQRDVKGPVKFRQSSKPSQRSGSKHTNKTVSIPPLPYMIPLNTPKWISLLCAKEFYVSLLILLLWEQAIKQMYYSSRAALNVPTFSTTFPTTNTNTPTHKNTNGFAQKLTLTSLILPRWYTYNSHLLLGCLKAGIISHPTLKQIKSC